MLRSSSACRVSTRVVMDGCFADASTAVVADKVGCRVGAGIGASRVNRSTRDDVAISHLDGFWSRCHPDALFNMAGGFYRVRQAAVTKCLIGGRVDDGRRGWSASALFTSRGMLSYRPR